MKKQIVFTGGLVFIILGLMGILSRGYYQISGYVVLCLGLSLFIAYYLIKARD